MESNWRLGVWKYGLTNLGLRLAARWLDLPNHLICQWTDGVNVACYQYGNVGDDRGWYFLGSIPITPAHPHFPYGFRVEPD